MDESLEPRRKSRISNSSLLLFGFATAFFPRLPTYFGAPAPLNFVHFFVILGAVAVVVLTTRVKDRQQKAIARELVFCLWLIAIAIMASALLNQAGLVNALLQFLLQSEPILFLLAMMMLTLTGIKLQKFRNLIAGFCLFNMLLALAQSVLLPIGIYPGSKGGQLIADNIAGVFASPGGSAGNYISATVSMYFAIYVFNSFKTVPRWSRILVLLGAVYQTYISDSKQIFVALFAGWVILVLTKVKRPIRMLLYIVPLCIVFGIFYWALVYTDIELLDPYRNFTTFRADQNLYGPDGQATQLKFAGLRIIPSYFTTPLNWLFGLGPGHTVSRLGGWMMQKYSSLLTPLGGTIHPASDEFRELIRSRDGWLARNSTMFFPMFTWMGIWGDLGIVGIFVYLYMGLVVWQRVCINDFCKFLVLSTAILGFILTQMEEPGHMLTVSALLGLSWHEKRQEHSGYI